MSKVIVRNNHTSLVIFKETMFLPGMNESNLETMEAFHKAAPHYFKEDDPIIEVEEIETEDGSEFENFDDIAAKKAVKLVRETFNLELLAKWSGESTKDTVRSALLKQIEKIEATYQPKED